VWLFTATLLCGACHSHRTAPGGDAGAAARVAAPYRVVEPIYQGGLKGGWRDASRSPVGAGAAGSSPARVSFASGGDWLLVRPSLEGRFGALAFRMKAPAGLGDFLEVRVDSTSSRVFPRVKVTASHCLDAGDGWVEALVPMSELDPEGAAFDRVVFRAIHDVGPGQVSFDEVGLTEVAGDAGADPLVAAPTRAVSMRIDCSAKPRPISPLIYGFSYYALTDRDAQGHGQWRLGGTIRRWGGDATSRYNWELGNASSAGKDWFWENVDTPPYTVFLDDDATHGIQSALTVPTIGWVAKDSWSVSFSTSAFPNQEKIDDQRPRAGNGKSKDGKDLAPPDPTTTSVAAPPEFIAGWVQAIRARDADAGKRSVDIYILDNEPALWSSTHRDVHPTPLTYDELLDRALRYGAAIRAADPGARIAGPAAWGWQELFFSGKDSLYPSVLRPDRRAHGDVPLLPWYLRRMHEEEEKSKVHILDLVDVHAYPQANNVYGNGAVDAATAALRVRSTRALWDPTYVDESYIRQPIEMLPRLHRWIDENFPGLGIEIGEWSFGGETDMSGGLATAEALGRFGQYDVATAFYWTYPPPDSPVTFAFRAFRDYDGKGARFLDQSLATSSSETTSLFASRDEASTRLVAIALNLDPRSAAATDVDISSCPPAGEGRVFTYRGNAAEGLAARPAPEVDPRRLRIVLPPYSITVIELPLAGRAAASQPAVPAALTR
jgi:hypothetical protein